MAKTGPLSWNEFQVLAQPGDKFRFFTEDTPKFTNDSVIAAIGKTCTVDSVWQVNVTWVSSIGEKWAFYPVNFKNNLCVFQILESTKPKVNFEKLSDDAQQMMDSMKKAHQIFATLPIPKVQEELPDWEKDLLGIKDEPKEYFLNDTGEDEEFLRTLQKYMAKQGYALTHKGWTG